MMVASRPKVFKSVLFRALWTLEGTQELEASKPTTGVQDFDTIQDSDEHHSAT